MEKLRVVLLAVVGLSFPLFGGATADHNFTLNVSRASPGDHNGTVFLGQSNGLNDTVSQQCPSGFFGYRCRFSCRCHGNDECDKVTGTCPRDCAQGYWGPGCQLSNWCSYNGETRLYMGKLNKTKYGRLCQAWSSQYPHDHGYKVNAFPDGRFPWNYCRTTPDSFNPWCYTTSRRTRWQYCGITNCTCPYGLFGHNCANMCHCKDRTEKCDSILGICKSGCDEGWTGTDCQTRLEDMTADPETPIILECKAGWYGRDCTYQCHCYQNDACGRSTGLCPRGCSKGWSGPKCNQENAEPVASYYCLRTSNGELRAQLTLSHQGRQFPLVKAVGQDAKPLTCSWGRVNVQRLNVSMMHVNLLLSGAFGGGNVTDDVSGNDTSDILSVAANRDDCIASWSTDGTVTWFIKFSRYAGLTIANDVIVEVKCDLYDAIALEVEHSFEVDSAGDVELAPGATPLNISVVLIDDFTGDEVERFHSGQQLRLEVRAEGLNEVECLYPRSCVARAKNGSADNQGVKLVNNRGCPVPGSPVYRFEAYSSTLKSNSFPAFTLGSDSVDIDCQVDIVITRSIYGVCPKPYC